MRNGVRALALLAALPMAAACGNPRADATRSATDSVRASAANGLAIVQGVVAESQGPGVLDRVLKVFGAGPDVFVFGRDERPDGSASLRVAIYGRGEAGGGGSLQAVVARVCVEYAITPGRAVVLDTPCDPSLPSATGNAGNLDIDVMLR